MRSNHKMKIYIKSLFVILFAITILGCQKTDWTAQEIKDWYAKYSKTNPQLYSPLYYKGSDDNYHYFTCRAIDTWVFMRVDIKEIKIINVKPYANTSSAPVRGYYAVDPLNEFEQIQKKD